MTSYRDKDNRNGRSPGIRAGRTLLSSLLCLLMMIALVVPAAVPAEVFAAEADVTAEMQVLPDEPQAVPDQTESADEQGEEPVILEATRFTAFGYDMTFSRPVATEIFLSKNESTDTLKAAGKWKSIKLTWSSVKNLSGISGYYILRRDLKSVRWRQIASVKPSKKSYTDKKAKTKNTLYRYMLVPYAKIDGVTYIANPSQWAAAVTTRSKKKNVTKIRVARMAMATIVRVGGTTTVPVKFSSKPYTKSLRWSSSNTKVAKVNSKGRITGLKAGKVTIYARAHTGVTMKFKIRVIEGGTAQSMIDVMSSWMGFSYLNQKNRGIVDIYNSIQPLPSGYRMGYYDAWCDCTVSAAGFVSGNEDKIGRECSVLRHIKIFKNKGIWIEGRKTVPEPGDLIVFNWYPKEKKNASHIGLVEKVEGDTITTIEGNMGIGQVGRRTIQVGWQYIRGYARPLYGADDDQEADSETTPETETGSTVNN